ncbi:MAG: hydrogenase nickel incorporation protein HypB [Hydrogenothermaceae bacterium]|nr:hydrogenase nickel incorporation protein HypB [Hydrogenothermaceae bacterium]
MCRECGCSLPQKKHHHGEKNSSISGRKTVEVEVLAKVLDANDKQANSNREHFQEHGILALNLMSSPGAGKTTLLERTIETLKGSIRIGVIEGDLETDRDSQRIRAKDVPAYQITTGQACHLDAFMVHKGIHQLPLEELDIVFIENVGNLVCPASYDVGAHTNVVLLSIPEGEDKPLKYPIMFHSADIVLITKVDLLPYIDFDIEDAKRNIKKVNPKVDIIPLSAKTGEGMDRWIRYLTLKRELVE